jgi:hypothetical protein
VTPDLLQHNPWLAAVALSMGVIPYLFDHGQIERHFWPEGDGVSPVLEVEVTRYRFRNPKRRMRVVGREWVGSDATAPASLCAMIGPEGASLFGVRCTMRGGAAHSPTTRP